MCGSEYDISRSLGHSQEQKGHSSITKHTYTFAGGPSVTV